MRESTRNRSGRACRPVPPFHFGRGGTLDLSVENVNGERKPETNKRRPYSFLFFTSHGFLCEKSSSLAARRMNVDAHRLNRSAKCATWPRSRGLSHRR